MSPNDPSVIERRNRDFLFSLMSGAGYRFEIAHHSENGIRVSMNLEVFGRQRGSEFEYINDPQLVFEIQTDRRWLAENAAVTIDPLNGTRIDQMRVELALSEAKPNSNFIERLLSVQDISRTTYISISPVMQGSQRNSDSSSYLTAVGQDCSVELNPTAATVVYQGRWQPIQPQN